MVRAETANQLAQKLPQVTTKDHFEGEAFVANGRIFATLWRAKNIINVRLNPAVQSQFVEEGGDEVEAIQNSWGKQGWTTVNLEFVDKELLVRILKRAWELSSEKTTPSKKSVVAKKARKKSKVLRKK